VALLFQASVIIHATHVNQAHQANAPAVIKTLLTIYSSTVNACKLAPQVTIQQTSNALNAIAHAWNVRMELRNVQSVGLVLS
jgi:hypothetical protein